MTLTELAEKWLCESRGLIGGQTEELYRKFLAQSVIPYFGNSVGALSAQGIEAFEDSLRERGLSENTAAVQERIVRHLAGYGASLGLCEKPGRRQSPGTPSRKRETVILSPGQEARLAEYLVTHPDGGHLCLYLMLTLGLSIGEALELQWQDVSLPGASIRIKTIRGTASRPKRTVRTMALDRRQTMYLGKLAGEPLEYLCSGKLKPVTRASLGDRFRKIVRSLDLPSMPPTALRHTWAMRRIEEGMDYETLSKQLGVDNTGLFRNFYRNLADDTQKERLEREHAAARKVRTPGKTRTPSEPDPQIENIQSKIELRRRQLQQTLDNLEGDLQIIRALRNSDGVQGQAREGLYRLVETLLGPDDKDGRYLVEYLRCNMRVASMPTRTSGTATVQTIRRRVARGFEKLCRRFEELDLRNRKD